MDTSTDFIIKFQNLLNKIIKIIESIDDTPISNEEPHLGESLMLDPRKRNKVSAQEKSPENLHRKPSQVSTPKYSTPEIEP